MRLTIITNVLAKIARPLMLFLIAALLIVICFGGTRTFFILRGYIGEFETWEHGWPGEFLSRSCNFGSTRFSVWEGKPIFKPWMLALDIVVFVGMLAALIFGSRWLQRRSHSQRTGLTFSIASLLVVMTICCVPLGSIGFSLANARREQVIMAELKKRGHQPNINRKYIGPIWLVRLLGEISTANELMFGGCRGIVVRSSDHAELTDVAVKMRSLPHVESLDFGDTNTTDAELQFFIAAGHSMRLTSIGAESTQITGTAFADPRNWPNLVEVDAAQSQLDDAGFANLARIPNLAVINVSGTKVTKHSLAEFAKLPKLEIFYCEGLGFTEADCAALTSSGVICLVKP